MGGQNAVVSISKRRDEKGIVSLYTFIGNRGLTINLFPSLYF